MDSSGALEQKLVKDRPRVRQVGRTERALGNESTRVCRDKRKSLIALIAASRTQRWLPSGWGCRGRRLSGASRAD
jgi:hypothetical protein